MRSLRGQLLTGTTIGSAIVLLISGVLLYVLIQETVLQAFDHALLTKARALSTMFEEDDGELEFEALEIDLPEFEPSAQAEYYQVWLADGFMFARSPSLGDADLPVNPSADEETRFDSITLPDGRPGRMASLLVTPRREYAPPDAPPPEPVRLAVARDTLSLVAVLARVRMILIGVGMIAVAVCGGLLAWLVRRCLRPVEDLSDQIEGVGASALSRRIDGSRVPAELTPVVERLNELLSRLEDAFQREQRFTGDVAHELRTPLAGLRAKLELSLSRERSPAEQRQTLSECLTITLQQTRLVENLLQLARADAGQLQLKSEPTKLTELLQACWRETVQQTVNDELEVEWQLASDGVCQTDPDALRLILQNLFQNAASYTVGNGPVQIKLAPEADAGVLTISNPSSLKPDQVQHVFERFWRADEARTLDHDSHSGLGLALCQRLIELLDGDITAAVAENGTFSIRLRLHNSD